jgi:hypothetical protein
MCIDHSDFRTFKRLPSPIIIEGGYDSTVIATHHGLVDVIHWRRVDLETVLECTWR